MEGLLAREERRDEWDSLGVLEWLEYQ